MELYHLHGLTLHADFRRAGTIPAMNGMDNRPAVLGASHSEAQAAVRAASSGSERLGRGMARLPSAPSPPASPGGSFRLLPGLLPGPVAFCGSAEQGEASPGGGWDGQRRTAAR